LSKTGVVLDSKKSSFTVNLKNNSLVPGSINKFSDGSKSYSFFHMLSRQYRKLGKNKKAIKYLKKAYELNKSSAAVLQEYSTVLLMKKDFQTVLNIVEILKDNNKKQFDYYSIKGRALYLKGSFTEAIDHLEKANKIYDSDIKVLNNLGAAYYKTNAKEQAIKIFKASLKINNNQKNVKKALEEIKKKGEK